MAYRKIKIIQGDITKMETDAIVNAANSSLMGGGGVDGAIHRAGGPAILEDCRAIVARQGGCKTGEAVITTGGRLPAKHVIHTVGPVWNGGNHRETTLLANCYLHALQLASRHHLASISFPNISTGIYHFPKDLAASIAMETIVQFLEQDDVIQEVVLVCFDAENYQLAQHYYHQYIRPEE
ncbi:O-acetyl-ADP-ribose deacetylase [Chitinophaga qingshengii]|uniref:O-acetyl-ADP-ribose deacetylase n=1 Tax=Chitinophaga qingshengii TaxID=1569794 RepID=A0ABR7TQ88_9BACT|nr:O-acetyl-ADP-ribose deacetylase [Chitinophaga qingshengii]MBC9931722.1 O-acetyl-ADP-ribose deacetylase [Chitinophaga qingshengii]